MNLSSINFKILSAAIKCALALFVSKFCSDQSWIISERPTQARDNGYCFFKFMKENHPEVSIYYLIDKKAPDYNKVKEYQSVIQFNSWKHYLMYCKSKIHISAHVGGCCPDGAIGFSRRTKKLIGFKDVFIPHGVSYGVSEFCLKKYTDINLFICSGKPEYDNVLKNYGYAENEVAYTGFPRLDGWHNITVNPKQIVFMPTWRLYLAQNPDTIFEQTEYYNAYQTLLNDSRLAEFLANNDLNLIFYLHNEMKKYADYFSTQCRNIEIVYSDDKYDIQELLKSSAMLITDYSSVHFDFAYMNKPVIYYQFDKETFFEKQYKKSDFDAEENGFGPVAYTPDELLKEITLLYSKQFKMPEKYKKRMLDFYQLYDSKNCERVYAVIDKMKGFSEPKYV